MCSATKAQTSKLARVWRLLPLFAVLATVISLAFAPRTSYAANQLPVGTDLKVSHHQGGFEVTIRTENGENRDVLPDTYTYYTGEESLTNIYLSNNDNQLEGYTVRVYMRFDSPGYRLPYTLGQQSVTTGGKTYNFSFNQASEDDVYYFEFPRPDTGDTATIPSYIMYPSPGTPGGQVELWATLLSPDEATALGTGVADKGNWELLDWTTKPDLFPVEKTRSSTEVYLLGNGEGGNDTVRGLVYDIDLVRGGSTLEGMGKDYVKEARFTDTIQLDSRFAWRDAVLEAVRNGNYSVSYDSYDSELGINTNDQTHDPSVMTIKAGGKKLFVLWHGSRDVLWNRKERVELAVDDQDRIVVSWSEVNGSIADNPDQPGNWTEIGNTHTQLYVGLDVLEYTGDITDPDLITQGVTITNKLSVTETYCYSDPKTYESQVDDTVRAREANLKMTKGMPNIVVRGEEGFREVTLWVTNTGSVPYTELYRINDILPYEFYLEPEGIVDFLKDTSHPEAEKSLEITQANLYAQPTTTEAMDYHGNTVYTLDVENTADGNLYWGAPLEETGLIGKRTLRLHTQDGTMKCDVFDGATLEQSFSFTDAATLRQGFHAIGYAPTHDTRYEVRYVYPEKRTIESGGRLDYKFRVWAKDSFQVAQGDQLHHINLEEGSRWNYAYCYKEDGTRISYDSSPAVIYQDATIVKGAYAVVDDAGDEEELEDGQQVIDDSVIEYVVKVTHQGEREYPVIPLVDSMQGIQIALARTDLNPGLAAKNLPTYEIDGVSYYMLNKPDTYSRVWFGEPDAKKLADHVVVTQDAKGLSTISYYYLDDYKGEVDSSTPIEREIRYRALVSIEDSGAEQAPLYRVDNCGYLNDHQGHRILDPVGFGVSPIYFDKRVIDERGSTPAGDVNVRDFSFFQKGEKTIYRLVLGHNNAPTGQFVQVTGPEIWDQLPETVQGLSWQRGDGSHPGDVTIEVYEDPGNVIWTNPDSWSIVDDTHDQGNTNPNQRYIKWGDDFKVEFWDRAVMYVTLTMPDGDTWNDYAQRFMNQRLRNTFHYHDYESYVQHELAEPIKAYLEKGVYVTNDRNAVGRNDPEQRFWYANNTEIYYSVSLVNTGEARLYINDLQDKLPRGFHIHGVMAMVRQGNPVDGSVSSQIGPYVIDERHGTNHPGVAYALLYVDGVPQVSGASLPRFGQVSLEKELRDGHEYVTFHISQASSTSRLGNDIKYDEMRGKCYLDPGEMIEFGYVCKIDAEAQTADTSENTIVMPVSDYAGAGVKVVEADVRTHEFDDALPNEGTCDHDADDNPTRNDRIENLGFIGEDTDTWWLKSDVTVRRGHIVPGITKAVTSIIDEQGIESANPVVARTTDTVRFNVHATNTGNQTMTDYVLQDTILSPYQFTGPLTLTFNKNLYEVGWGPKYTGTFDIVERNHHLGHDRLTITYPTSFTARDSFVLTVDGGPVQRRVYFRDPQNSYANYGTYVNLWMSVETEIDGSETVKFSFENSQLPLYPSDSVDIDVRANDPSNAQILDRLINECFITPLRESFDPDDVTQGNNTTTKDIRGNERAGVRNSVSIPFAASYQSTSYKKVEELDNPDNWGMSYLPDRNWINLPAKNSLFAFTDYVFFATEKPVEDFIVIDNLPQVGDHMTYENSTPRDSKFEVSLAPDPQFVVTVTDKDGNVTTLDPSQYVLEFADHTEFSRDDWEMAEQSPNPWYAAPKESTRSFRVRILDRAAALIQPESTVAIRYVCEITDELRDEIAGLISWNSFGYRYLVHNDTTYLEAAPLKVGIRFPLPPSVKKNLVTYEGGEVKAEKDQTYRFLTFKGTILDVSLDLTGEYTDEQLGEALASAGLEFGIAEVTVPAGESASPAVQMDNEHGFVKWKYENGEFKALEGREAFWTWTEGEAYTTIELPSSRGTDIEQVKFYEDRAFETWEFTWRYDIVIECDNVVDTWNIRFYKSFQHNGQADTDPGNYGVFGLYSASELDMLTPEVASERAQAAGLSEVPELQTQAGNPEDPSGLTKTFYLMDIVRVVPREQESYAGPVTWEGLTRDEYVLRELDAPEKYIAVPDAYFYREGASEYNHTFTAYIYNTDMWQIRVWKGSFDAPEEHVYPAGFVLYGPDSEEALSEEEFDREWQREQGVISSAASVEKPARTIEYTLPNGEAVTLYARGISTTHALVPDWWAEAGTLTNEAYFTRLTSDYYVLREVYGPEGMLLADDVLIANDRSFEGADAYPNTIDPGVLLTVFDKTPWTVSVEKLSEEEPVKALDGAVFGLYVNDQDAALSDDEAKALAQELGLDETPAMQIERDGVSFYLARMAQSSADAPTVFEELCSTHAIVRELKAPEGYFLAEDLVFSKFADEDEETIDAVMTEREVTVEVHTHWYGDGNYSYKVKEYSAQGSMRDHATKSCEVALEASKRMAGSALAAGDYSFELVDAAGTVIETVTNDGAGAIKFSPLAFDEYDLLEQDSYRYTIREIMPESPKPGVSYDGHEEAVSVTLSYDDGGELVANASYDSDGAVFENSYSSKGEAVIEASKKLTGAKLEEGMFSFELLDEDGAVIQTATNDASGKVVFAPIEFTGADAGKSFNYSIREHAEDGTLPQWADYEFDTHVATATVTVSENGDGSVSCAVTYEGNNEFENRHVRRCELALEATKLMTGRELVEGEFAFELLDSEGTVVETVTNAADGSVKFSPLAFSDDYLGQVLDYTIREVVPAELEPGVTYDGHEEHVTVEFSINEADELVATASYDEDDAVFINRYTTTGELALEVTKKLTGAKLKEGMFDFELRTESGLLLETASNDADGKVRFSPVKFTVEEAGETFTFTIRESTAGKTGPAWANYRFDKHVVTVTVKVTDNGDGTASCSASYSGDTVFTNAYEEPSKPKKPTPKTGEELTLLPFAAAAGGAALAGVGARLKRKKRD